MLAKVSFSRACTSFFYSHDFFAEPKLFHMFVIEKPDIQP